MTDDQRRELKHDRLKAVICELRRAAGRAREDGREADNDIMHRAADLLEGPEWDGLS